MSETADQLRKREKRKEGERGTRGGGDGNREITVNPS